jgi:hypothetical protein
MKRLVRAQQAPTQQDITNQILDPYDPNLVKIVNNTAKTIEQSFFQGISNNVHIQDIIPYNVHNTFQSQIGMDLNRYVNPNELIRLITQELNRDHKAYNVIQKYLTDKYRIYVNQHNQQVQHDQQQAQQ